MSTDQTELINILKETDPEQLQEMIRLGILTDEQGQLARQLQSAESVRSTPMPRGEMRGRVYVPASGMENALAMYDRIRGEVESRGAKGRQNEILGEKTAGRMSYLDLLRGKQESQEPISRPFEF